MGTTFLFYDLETTGLSRAFDQILEFAAIRTDADLNEIERLATQIRLRPDVVPSPAALLVNRIRVARFSSGDCEYEAMRKIHAWLNTPGTISIGYNSIGFLIENTSLLKHKRRFVYKILAKDDLIE